jgi:hypothetical protein
LNRLRRLPVIVGFRTADIFNINSKNPIHLLKYKLYTVWAILGTAYYNIAYSSLLMLLVRFSA